jgi:HEAT repeat protein/lysophospholipase L1-like esterase
VTRRELAQNLGLSLAATAVFLGALEAGARLVETKRPTARPVADYIWNWQDKMDGGDFYVIRSEAIGWPPWEEINGDGLRDRTHPVEKPPGFFRIAFLGDSVTLGAGIKPAEAYPQVLEARLRAAGRRVEVLNVALWGWSTRQERIAYARIARKYRPDAVVLAVCLNDIPELQNNLTQPPRWLAALHHRSALARRLVDASGREIQSVEQLFDNQDSAKVREAFTRFFDEVRMLRKEVEADGGRFALVVFPFRFQVEAKAPPPTAQDAIAAFCAREAIPFQDLLPVLRPRGPAAFVDYDHLSADGAAIAAEALAASDLVPPHPSDGEILGAWLEKDRGATAAPARLWLRDRAASHAPAAVAGLMAALSSPDADVRAAAAWALETMGGAAQPAVPVLRTRLAGDESPAVRAAAARALGAMGPAASPAAPTLFTALADGVTDVRWQAALALSRLDVREPDAVVPPLATALRSPDPYVRGFAAWSLGAIGPAARAAVPALVEALAQDDGYGRGGAAAALAKMGPAAAAAVPALLEGLRSPDGDRRWKAARTLGRIGPAAHEAVPALAAALHDPNEYVRAHAARALGRIGTLPGDASAALQAATGDGDENVRREAREALGRGR